jgi:hypothetical protein
VNATFIGEHALDDRLPDFSPRGIDGRLSTAHCLLDESRDLQPTRPAEALDLRLARGFLKTEIWELGSRHFQGGNPSLYCGEALFGVLSLFLSEYAPLKERARAAEARLRAIPRLLGEGRGQVRAAPRPWTERALTECRGALLFLGEGIEILSRMEGVDSGALRAAADEAAAAFRAFGDALASLPDSSAIACGGEALALYMREGHFLAETPEEVVRYAEDELAAARAALAVHAGDFGATSPDEALARLGGLHPRPNHYLGRYEEVWTEAKEAAAELVTWPELPVRYSPLPAWARGVAPHAYFLPYRSPALLRRPPVHDVWVAPLGGTPEEEARTLAANNDSVIKLNYVVHHGGLGHHVQNARAFEAPSRIGRVAAIDGASRIALFCGGTMAEGWACYATDLMAERGYLTPLERYAESRTRARMCARAVADVRLHLGEWTLEEVAQHYEAAAGMPASAARAEAVKNSMFPGAALMYVMGTDAIHRLRRELKGRPGFSLKAFHDRFLSFGSVPVALVAEAMRGPDAL